MAASMIATFDITKAKGEDGREIDPIVDFSNGVVRYAQ
jgi:hypothetical protein